MNSLSVIFIVAKYPATYGHTSVINNLCRGLTNLGHKTAIGAFHFESEPPENVEKVQLNILDAASFFKNKSLLLLNRFAS